MKITFFGAGASEGIPAVFCECALCRQARAERKFFTRSQVLLDDDFLIDFPPDSYYRALMHGVDLARVRHILVTHSHSDHFYAEDFFMRGLASSYCLAEPTVTVYESKAVTDFLERFHAGYPQGMYAHEPLGIENGYEKYPQSTEYVCVTPWETFTAGEYTVTAYPSAHMPDEPSMIFAVEKKGKRLLYATDTGRLSARIYDFMQKDGKPFDAVAYDCTYGTLDFNEGHMNFADCADMRAELIQRGLTHKSTVHILTHVSHNAARSLPALFSEVPDGFILAHDGTEVIL